LALLTVVASMGTAFAQGDSPVVVERARLKAERDRAEAEYQAQEKACYGKFAVNDCIDAARAKRRQIVSDLRRQEVSLNDSERKRKAAERQQSLESRRVEQAERSAPQANDKATAGMTRQQPNAELGVSKDTRTSSSASNAVSREEEIRRRTAEKAAAERSRSEDASKNVQEREKRLAAAEERRQKQARRLADRKKPPAEPLPVPR